MESNPLKWPSFEQLGRDLYDNFAPAMQQLESGTEGLDDEAKQGLARIQSWLDAPCVATVKLDGTNVGIDENGLVVGRNAVVPPGENYQKVDVFKLFDGYPEKIAQIRDELVGATGEQILQTMLYGELVMQSKYNYDAAGIFKQWLCFGMVLRVAADDDEAPLRASKKLRAAGFNCKWLPGIVRVTQNARLAALLHEFGVVTVAEAYRPAGNITDNQWAEHDGAGNLACFQSLRQLIFSPWAQRFLLPTDGVPLGEGLVVASEADGKLFKWKQAGEDLGKVPDLLAEVVTLLQGIQSSGRVAPLPPGLLEVFQQLLLVATTKPRMLAKDTKKNKDAPKMADDEANAVWESTLTKYDTLESFFAKGQEAQKVLQTELIEQVARDLEKDYCASEKDAQQWAKKVVSMEMGKRFGLWKKSQAHITST